MGFHFYTITRAVLLYALVDEAFNPAYDDGYFPAALFRRAGSFPRTMLAIRQLPRLSHSLRRQVSTVLTTIWLHKTFVNSARTHARTHASHTQRNQIRTDRYDSLQRPSLLQPRCTHLLQQNRRWLPIIVQLQWKLPRWICLGLRNIGVPDRRRVQRGREGRIYMGHIHWSQHGWHARYSRADPRSSRHARHPANNRVVSKSGHDQP